MLEINNLIEQASIAEDYLYLPIKRLNRREIKEYELLDPYQEELKFLLSKQF